MDTLTLAAGFTPLPKRIDRLLELAYNLWWSWHPEARALYQRIDPDLWEEVYHNPVKFLREVRQVDLDKAAQNAEFLRHYHQILADFDSYQVFDKTWYQKTYPQHQDKQIAYFSAEFGLHESLPIYSGGLGILAGDTTKECSDLGIPLVGIGFLYPQGYFKQLINPEGNQEAIYEKVSFSEVPALPAFDKDGREIVISVDLPGRQIYVKVWKIQVGNVPIYMMDTDIHPNRPEDRELSARLYHGGLETRLAQEMVLGIGGVRILRKLGIEPAVYHMNEGHSAFLVLERLREYVTAGVAYDEAVALIKASTVFTTHTPVPAGHDAFPFPMMEQFFAGFWDQLGLNKEAFLEIARHDQNWGPTFSMTVLGMRLSGKQNGVSKLHGQITRQMWHWLWPEKTVEETPVSHVTNGIHTESWLAPEWKAIFDEMMGPDWVLDIDDQTMWQAIDQISDERLWQIRNTLRTRMLNFIRQRTRARLIRLGADQAHLDSTFHLFNDNALTIGFARRFATYKRATLLFSDLERLSRILNNPQQPVLLVFAGKAHPHDLPGQELIKAIHDYSLRPEFIGKIILLEGYDMALARKLVTGVDVWLNTPEYPLEASGTSGQKAAINGVINLSVLDGWWGEGFDGSNGWAIHPHQRKNGRAKLDLKESNDLLDLLERKVLPLYFDGVSRGYSKQWVELSKASMRSCIPRFNGQRMVVDYLHGYYAKAIAHHKRLVADRGSPAQTLAQWKRKIHHAWSGVSISRADHVAMAMRAGEALPITVRVNLNGLAPDDVIVECLAGGEPHGGNFDVSSRHSFIHLRHEDGLDIFELHLQPPLAGLNFYRIRFYPHHPLLAHPFETGCMIWL